MRAKPFILLAIVALFAACKGSHGDYEVVNNKSKAGDNSQSADTAQTDSAITEKLVKTADMSFKVKSVQRTGDTIAAFTGKIGGMVMHHQMSANVTNSQDIRVSTDSLMRVSAFSTSADMTVKVPSEKLQEFLLRVSHMGMYVTSRQMDIADKSLDYLSAQMKLQSRKELIDQQKSGRVTIKDPAKVLWLKDDMIDGQIENRRIDRDVKYSTISLSFYQSNTIVKEMVANDDPAAYQLPFFSRLAMALANGWAMFVDFIVGLANLWVFILAGIGIWVLYKIYGKKLVSVHAKS